MMRPIQMRAPEPVQREIARHLEHDIANEEDAGAEAEHFRGEAEILVHGERGEADIDPLEKIHRIAEDEEWDQAAARLGDGAAPMVPRHDRLQMSASGVVGRLKRASPARILSYGDSSRGDCSNGNHSA
jgi:hypothetical protein